MRILSHEIPSAVGQSVTVAGWVHRRRRLAAVSFLILRDRSGLAQIVVKESPEQLDELTEETVVQVTGTVAANPQAPGGAELVDPVIEPLTEPAATPPIELWRPSVGAGLPVVLDNAPVTLRHPVIRAGAEIAAAAMYGFRSALGGQGFTEIQTPKIVGTATESGANVFALDYFGGPAYLAQSPQFYKQTMVGVFERVFEVGPVFRAEPHDTVRHLAEYVSLDAEFGFITDHRDVLAMLRAAIAGMLAAVGERAGGALERLGVALPEIPVDVPVLHFTEALKIAGANPDEPDLAPADERAIGAWALSEHGSDFVAVEGYPMAKRPFYTHPQPSDPRWSNSFDLLFRGVELVTGGQRLHRYSDYAAALTARGESPDAPAYTSYLQAFKHGMPPHGGFAIGLERFVSRLTGAENIREVTLFPRDLHRLTP
ncbi:aspartate--tRNA(Asn) ligase [Kribbella solani]|uniref:aspartate--tRNA(Asn) ligase n=1 Tax=Kribbella solani TaxID=236067 RepID=UPI0029BD919E|nr:aspartate--tRNA(Asn) ligase [Kribbella solani]MDX2973802.1 aspartate--tRNA(Asn) ligase [Kribbella solani]MDX2973803.1 aspartate--tRNA(Asn) ligase [Kribbella solani]MDX3003035.1 aspartate--tRNA(Asn) ligase [Kribbella solani]